MIVHSRLRRCAEGEVGGAVGVADFSAPTSMSSNGAAADSEDSAPLIASRNSATVCGRLPSSGLRAQSIAWSRDSPYTVASARLEAGSIESSFTRDADSTGLRPVVIQYITAPME